ncbi:MAG: xanthine phosphoribosyltransferase [Bacillota bacterium]|nr:xanthine phosphoribosyltransferase [Bacillota bacterium]
MKFLDEKILEDGQVVQGNIVKVDSFLNHQVDVGVLKRMAEDSKEYFKDTEINKILTIESSGISIAAVFAMVYNVPFVFAKKSSSLNLDKDKYVTMVKSFTYKTEYPVAVSKRFLDENDKVLIVDDFLAEGNAAYGLIDLCRQAGAEVVGINIAIEKAFQNGGKNLRADGYKLYSQSIIDRFEDGQIIFR